ncbi:hypothetical protein NL154_00875 [Rhizobium sp. YTUHZ044]|uniref:hypothetical protein n=1 Tax=Rhizobium sp. YTUHZ044 TaxID=2962678 RepID=UPI003DA92C84
MVIGSGPRDNGVSAVAGEVYAVEYVADNLGNFLCGSAFGVFFLHAASYEFFQI